VADGGQLGDDPKVNPSFIRQSISSQATQVWLLLFLLLDYDNTMLGGTP
jgi:hypothetical protein